MELRQNEHSTRWNKPFSSNQYNYMTWVYRWANSWITRAWQLVWYVKFMTPLSDDNFCVCAYGWNNAIQYTYPPAGNRPRGEEVLERLPLWWRDEWRVRGVTTRGHPLHLPGIHLIYLIITAAICWKRNSTVALYLLFSNLSRNHFNAARGSTIS